MKIIQIAAAALLVLVAAAIAGVARPEPAESAADEARTGITVTGTGRVTSVPDEATFVLGVRTTGETARAALGANSARMRAVIAALREAGVARRDIRTEHVSVGMNYDEDGSGAGYVASNSVSVRIRDLNRTGAVLDAASAAGANEVSGPQLERQDRAALEADALQKAVDDARGRAAALARAADVRLGAVTAITEATAAGPLAYGERLALDASTEAPIEKGTEEIGATVTVTFAIE